MSKLAIYALALTSSFTFALAANVEAQQQELSEIRINISEGQKSLLRSFAEIEGKSEFVFAYTSKDLRNKVVNISKSYWRMDELLKEISSQTDLSFKRVNETITVRKIDEKENHPPLIDKIIQTRTITGKVTTMKDGEGLPGVNVIEKGTNNGTVTNVQGQYSLEVSEGATLVFSSVGYTSEEVEVGNQSVIDLTMAEDVQQLQELVVVGYGTQRKRDLTGAVGQVDSKKINELPVAGFDQAIQGKLSGVRVSNSNAAPGGGLDIQIRGVGSITGSSFPLVVIDGMPMADENFQAENNPFNLVNPNDIESVEVLKDASSAAIYGARAANGVILITTKSGSGKPKFNVNLSQGVAQNINVPEVANAEEYNRWTMDQRNYAYYRNDPAWYNPDETVQPTFKFGLDNQEDFDTRQANLIALGLLDRDSRAIDFLSYDPNNNSANAIRVVNALFNGTTPFENVDTDWVDVIQNDGAFPGSQANYNVSASGSNGGTRYLVSGGYFNQQGIIRNTDYERITANINLDFDVNEWLKIGTKLSPSWQDLNNMGGNQVESRWFLNPLYQTSLLLPPVFPPYNENGEIFDFSRNSDFSRNDLGWHTGDFLGNPLYRFLLTDNRKTFRTLANFWTEASFLNNFKLRSALATDYSNEKSIRWQPSTYGSRFSSPGPQNFASDGDNVLASHRKFERNKYYWENILTFDKQFADVHNLNVIAGYTQEETNFNFLFAEKRGFTSDAVPLIAGGIAVRDQENDVNDGAGRNAFIGILGRVQYNYNQKYYLTAGIRRDGSSRFGSETLWGNFPSLALAWRLSEEQFMQGFGFIDDLKLRGSYGETGNSSIPDGRQQRIIGTNSYIMGGQLTTGFVDARLFDPGLGWEKTREFNAGIDLSMLNGRLNLSADVYHRTTTDMLLSVNLPDYVGFNSILRNFGGMENRGFELAIQAVPIAGAVTWSTDFNISQNVGKVTQLFVEESQPIFGQSVAGRTATRAYVGGPMSLFWGGLYDGIYNDWDEVFSTPSVFNYSNGDPFSMSNASSHPGETKLIDVNGDGVIDGNDDTVIGNPWPDFYWGFSNTVTYKGFDLFVQMDGVIGSEVYNWVKSEWYVQALRSFNMPKEYVNDYWTPDNTNASNPIIATSGGRARQLLAASSLLVENGDFIAVRNLRLGYRLPASLMDNFFVRNLRLYLNVQNALYITSYEGYNPEGNNRGSQDISQAANFGVDGGNYPIARTITLGIDIGL